MLGIALLELISAGAASGIIDSIIPDLDADIDTEIDTETDIPALSRLLGWLRGGKVPLLIYLVCFLTTFSITGFIGQSISMGILERFLPTIIIIGPVFFVSVFITRSFCGMLSKVCIKDETSAVSRESFVGKIATITVGTAQIGKPAEAKLNDKYGNTHYVYVEPNEEGAEYPKGTQVLLLGLVEGKRLFKAVINPNKKLVD